jgi:hypothetical protein
VVERVWICVNCDCWVLSTRCVRGGSCNFQEAEEGGLRSWELGPMYEGWKV